MPVQLHDTEVIKAPLVMTDPGDIVTINGAQNITLRDFTVAGPLPDSLFCSLFLRTGVRVIGGGTSDAAREISLTVASFALAAGAAAPRGTVEVAE